MLLRKFISVLTLNMNKSTFNTIFFIRKFFLSPISYEKKPSRNKQIYVFLLLLLYTCIAVMYFSHNFSSYKKRTLIQMVLRTIFDFVVYFAVIIPIIRIKKMTRNWWFLIRKLSQFPCYTTSKKTFFAWYLTFWFCTLLLVYFHLKFWGFFFPDSFYFDTFLCYAHYFEIITAITVLQSLKQCYQSQKQNLELSLNSRELLHVLAILEHNLVVLKECVNCFNALFGWSILLHHIFGISRNLIFLDDSVKKEMMKATYGFLTYSLQLFLAMMLLIHFWVFRFCSVFQILTSGYRLH